MGKYAIKMPDIGEGIAEVEVVAWRVKPGDIVTEDQTIADVMTDKATVEIPSPVGGVVLELGCAQGALLAVGAELLRLEVEGAGNAKAGSDPEVGQATTERVLAPVSQHTPTLALQTKSDAGVGRQQSAVDVVAPPPLPGERPLASPAVRQRAWDLGVELQFVNGSGPAGRITHADLDVYLASRGRRIAVGPVTGYARREGEQAVPLIGLRRKIAQKMLEAKRRIPHFSYVEEVDVTELEGLRATLNGRHGSDRAKLTLLPLLIRATVLALRDHPQMNARFDDEAGFVTQYAPVHLGIATQTDAGLMVPVLRHAESQDPWSSAREIVRLADACRSGKATREELSGSTITISSLGPLGGIASTPVINHPEVAILGVNRIVERPALREGHVVARKLMNLSSSFDHRVVDGVDAAQFIQSIRVLLETPALLFVE